MSTDHSAGHSHLSGPSTAPFSFMLHCEGERYAASQPFTVCGRCVNHETQDFCVCFLVCVSLSYCVSFLFTTPRKTCWKLVMSFIEDRRELDTRQSHQLICQTFLVELGQRSNRKSREARVSHQSNKLTQSWEARVQINMFPTF